MSMAQSLAMIGFLAEAPVRCQRDGGVCFGMFVERVGIAVSMHCVDRRLALPMSYMLQGTL